MTPMAPRSVTFWIVDSSASDVRIIGAAPSTPGHVSSIRRTSSYDMVLCCISNQM